MITIYALTCATTRKAYVGSTKGDLGKRMREHRCLLISGQHKTAALLAEWRQFGPNDFIIHALQTMPGASLLERREAEVNWMDRLAADGLLYNEHRISMRPSDEAIRKGVANAHREPGRRWTPEANELRSIAQLGIPKGHGAKISATKRANRAKREQVMR